MVVLRVIPEITSRLFYRVRVRNGHQIDLQLIERRHEQLKNGNFLKLKRTLKMLRFTVNNYLLNVAVVGARAMDGNIGYSSSREFSIKKRERRKKGHN